MAKQQPPAPELPGLDKLIAIMAALRNPDGGCPWDLQQDFTSIAPYTIEEAYEVADAIGRGDFTDLRDELGDLLLQVVFHGRMAEEAGHFDFNDVANAISEKMIRRHPHVFTHGEERDVTSQSLAWEDQKALERQEKREFKGADNRSAVDLSVLADVAMALPALMRAEKLQKRAARVGFDWPDATPVFAKMDEEIAELQAALTAPQPSQDHIREEIGDILFSAVNLARKLKVDPEQALREANAKFTSRFQYIERRTREDEKPIEQYELAELEQYWQAAKSEQTV